MVLMNHSQDTPTPKESPGVQRDRDTSGGILLYNQSRKTLHEAGSRPCWLRAFNRNVRHTSFDIGCFATLTDGITGVLWTGRRSTQPLMWSIQFDLVLT